MALFSAGAVDAMRLSGVLSVFAVLVSMGATTMTAEWHFFSAAPRMVTVLKTLEALCHVYEFDDAARSEVSDGAAKR